MSDVSARRHICISLMRSITTISWISLCVPHTRERQLGGTDSQSTRLSVLSRGFTFGSQQKTALCASKFRNVLLKRLVVERFV